MRIADTPIRHLDSGRTLRRAGETIPKKKIEELERTHRERVEGKRPYSPVLEWMDDGTIVGGVGVKNGRGSHTLAKSPARGKPAGY